MRKELEESEKEASEEGRWKKKLEKLENESEGTVSEEVKEEKRNCQIRQAPSTSLNSKLDLCHALKAPNTADLPGFISSPSVLLSPILLFFGSHPTG